jgi:hypothetical protein
MTAKRSFGNGAAVFGVAAVAAGAAWKIVTRANNVTVIFII